MLPKPAAFWYAAKFLQEADPASRQPVGLPFTIRIVDDWAASPDVGPPTSIRVVSSSDSVQLLQDGVFFDSAKVPPGAGFATLKAPSFHPGSLMAVAYDASGKQLGTHSIFTPGAPVALSVVMAAPSSATGTAPPSAGRDASLVADGRDSALLHCFIVDSQKRRVVYAEPTNVTFRVVSGPGRISGSGSADPTQAHAPPSAPWQPTYHGSVSVVVRVTADALTPTRLAASDIDVDSGANGSTTVHQGGWTAPDIVVEATAPGLTPATISIPVDSSPSGWAVNSVLASAASAAGPGGSQLLLRNLATGM